MKRYLTPKQVFQTYGIEPQKIYWWVRTNAIPYTKAGKSVLIPEGELMQFLKNNTVEPVTEDRVEA